MFEALRTPEWEYRATLGGGGPRGDESTYTTSNALMPEFWVTNIDSILSWSARGPTSILIGPLKMSGGTAALLAGVKTRTPGSIGARGFVKPEALMATRLPEHHWVNS